MKSFLSKVVRFLLPIILLSWPADIFISTQLVKSKYYAQDEYSVWTDLYDGKINADIAIYGSSRAWVHIDPHMIEKRLGMPAYNLGIDGHNFWLQYLRHELLLKNNKTPQIIIYSLDMFTLEKKNELYNADQFLPYMLFNSDLKKYIDKYEGYAAYDYYIPLVRYYGKRKALKYAVRNCYIPVDPDTGRSLGYKGKHENWNKDFDLATKAMEYYEVKPDSLSVTLFKEFLKECREKKIQLIFVYTPELLEGQKFVKNRSDIMKMYNALALENGIPFFDYSDNAICSNRDYFYNASHLKIEGAEKFTSILIDDILRMSVINRPPAQGEHDAGK